MATKVLNIHKNINTRGNNEQELQYLFPSLYGEKALHKREKGAWAQMEHRLKHDKFRI